MAAAPLTLNHIQTAWNNHDPQLITLIENLCKQPDPKPDKPIRPGALTFDRFLKQLRDPRFLSKTREEQAHARIETLKALESPTAEVPLPDRLKIHEVIYGLWQSKDPLARDYLLRVIAAVPLVYGPWRALKRIFKEAEARDDTEVYGAIVARIDQAFASPRQTGVGAATLGYCARRAWRYLRRTAIQLPATYADIATDVLIHYTHNTNWNQTWVYNHILFHNTKKYGRSSFHLGWKEISSTELKHRAYPELWKRSPRPLFTLLERAKCDTIRAFAAAALVSDFRQVLNVIEPAWVIRLIPVPSSTIHRFVIWLLQNVPKFEQGAFRTLGLHEPVLQLLDSPADDARVYAANYARTHARDLTIAALVRLADNSHEAVRKLARDLLGEKDPRRDVGLAAWGQLLDTEHGHKLAAQVITNSFGPADLTPEWFQGRLLSRSPNAFEFASKLLPKVHPPKTLGPEFFFKLVQNVDPEDKTRANRVGDYAETELAKFDINDLPQDMLRWLALSPLTYLTVDDWIEKGKARPQNLGMDFLKALAFQPDWEAYPWLTEFRARHGAWAKELEFSEWRANKYLKLFADVRKFTTSELGFEWLMRLVARSEPMYHDFARDRLIHTFLPADFAPQATAATSALTAPADLNKASFLFTGKMATMVREEAEKQVKERNGTIAGSVTPKLHYLVIGDEGSPLYGKGSKGSKQTKAEELNDKGANIRIISETMFLQMIAGAQTTHSADATLAGCERLWELLIAPGPVDAPVARFAREYLRRHHPDIGRALNNKPVDPGSEIPHSFLTFERVSTLFRESRRPLREFALEVAKWEFARWNPNVDDLVGLAEIPFVDVRRFVAKAILAEDTPSNRRFRIDPATLEPSAAYRFCESSDEETRALGMELIHRLPKLRVPEELFRLTESPDRKVRAFVIRALWQVYRDRGVTADWKPPLPPKPTVGAKAKKTAEKAAREVGPGVPHRPETWPAGKLTLAQFLRRILFELPPGRPEKSRETVDDSEATPEQPAKPTSVVKAKPLPARRAKLDLVEVMRDLAMEDPEFAAGILPLLDEFMLSRGKSEREACLVAVTRIRKTYPTLKAM